ncbi:endonuclease/exonuclease/phosphatase family protein [Lentisphaerota bacterium ZTH]|nr:endonuclease/exonuclease/phosphatase family protein [Lentisphaerota bacterium]WET05174.1 endonuclease/exonuclease/phosphatase family protein [Lentisphaerota bacterium ZTH]
MRFLIYNIAYGTGSPGGAHKRLLTTHRYIKTPDEHFEQIIDFIRDSQANVVGLIEADTGSYRTDRTDQVKRLASHLNHFHVCDTKYGRYSLLRFIPFLRNHANAILTSYEESRSYFHYLPRGMKKLVIESEINGVVFYLVHLALSQKARAEQLRHLARILPDDKPVIVAGDFNTMQGEEELHSFMEKCGLINPNTYNVPTYPAWRPQKQLDYILCSKDIQIRHFKVPDVEFSDHLPLLLDFEAPEIKH